MMCDEIESTCSVHAASKKFEVFVCTFCIWVCVLCAPIKQDLYLDERLEVTMLCLDCLTQASMHHWYNACSWFLLKWLSNKFQ